MKEIRKMSALSLGIAIRNKEISVLEAVKDQLEVIAAKEKDYNAYITVCEELALQEAQRVQEAIDQGEFSSSLLAGVPVAIKDNISTKGVKTTCGSKILSNYTPTFDATVIDRLKSQGAIILGKTNMDEFAMGSTTETSYFGATKNPKNTAHVPGGSSGGSAAAVAAGEAFYALGSDTGGSIRQPASYCGVVGIKPTYGSVSRYGLLAYASSLDQIGTFGRDVADCMASLEVISGHDKKDGTTATKQSYSYLDSMKEGVKGLKIGIPRGYLSKGLDPVVKEQILLASKELERQGAVVEEFDLDTIDYAIPSYYVIACAEASSNLSRYDGVKYGYRTEGFEGLQDLYKKSRTEGFGEEVKRRMMIGAFVLSSGYYDAYYNKASKVRALIHQGFQKAFDQYDLILGPTAPQTAPTLGESLSDPLKMYLSDIYTVSVNLAGLPALSLPYGEDGKGLPIGVQLIARHFGEREIARAAYTLEQSLKTEKGEA